MKFQGLKKCCNFFNDNIDNDDDDDNNNDDDNILSIFFYLRVRWSKFEFAIAYVQFFFFNFARWRYNFLEVTSLKWNFFTLALFWRIWNHKKIKYI